MKCNRHIKIKANGGNILYNSCPHKAKHKLTYESTQAKGKTIEENLCGIHFRGAVITLQRLEWPYTETEIKTESV